MGCMLALKRAGSAFTISANDGCKAPEAASQSTNAGPEKGRFSVHEISQSWLYSTRAVVAMGCMLVLKRAGSAFTMSVKDG